MTRHQAPFFSLLACLFVAQVAPFPSCAQSPPQASLEHFGGLNPIARTLNIATVSAMLDAGRDPNVRDPNSGATLLHYAVLYDQPDVAEMLLAHKADVNARIDARGPETGATPLIYAVVQNELALAKLLIAHGADVRSTYRSGRTALHIAASGGNTEIARLLLQNGADPNVRDRAGSSPLDEAAWNGFPEITTLLLQSGAQINEVQTATGATPLNEAAYKGRNAVVQLLFAHNADPTIQDNSGFLPIENAIRSHYTETARIILQHTKAGLPDNSLVKFLGEAVAKGQEDTVEMLVNNGADLNAHLASGSTVVGLAALEGKDAVLELLIAKGANVNSRAKDGTMPLYDAALNGHASTAAILLSNGAEINAQETETGTTALYAAASYGHEDVAALLLQKGADPNILSKQGESPLHVALRNGNVAVANLIRQHGGRDAGKQP